MEDLEVELETAVALGAGAKCHSEQELDEHISNLEDIVHAIAKANLDLVPDRDVRVKEIQTAIRVARAKRAALLPVGTQLNRLEIRAGRSAGKLEGDRSGREDR